MNVSIIIPTYNERDNVRVIAQRIEAALAAEDDISYHIWFIDDSRDDTPEILEDLAKSYSHIHFVHRENGRGLGTAVVEGIRRSDGEVLIVMDADLQHPPELLPTMIRKLEQGVEVVIPSRFVPGGSDGGLNRARKFVSWTARSLGRMAIRRLRQVTDCTGGYFGVRRSVVDGTPLNPIGWKILMEILVKGNYQTVHEVPYTFTARDAGESKMSLREQWNYLRHIVALVAKSPEDRRFYIFCLVGGLGTIVNLLFMGIFIYLFHWYGTTASITASLIAMGHNYLWNDQVTWRDRSTFVSLRRWLQLTTFILISIVSIAVTALFAYIFHRLRLPILLGQLVGIATATVWSFMANNRFTWGGVPSANGSFIQVTRDEVRHS